MAVSKACYRVLSNRCIKRRYPPLLGLARQGYVSNLEAGRKAPSLDLVVQIADLFGVTIDYLLRGTTAVEQADIQRWADTALDIRPDDQAKLFLAFSQVDPSGGRQCKGLG